MLGSFEKLGILFIIILVVVILVLAIWGVGVPPEELFPGDSGTDLSSETENGHANAAGSGGEEIVLPPERPAPPGVNENAGIWPEPPPPEQNGPPSVPDRPAPAPVVEPPAPPAPAATEHVVKKGETLSSISLAHYGTKAHWKKIQAANPGIDPRNLDIGAVLRIPSLDAPAARPAPAPAENVYIVRKGDSLWTISRALGVSMKRLHDANRSVIGPDAASIKPDMRLTVPR